jgi:hypothetical protein
MGSRITKPEIARASNQKVVEFKTKFLEESAIELKLDCSPASSNQSSPVASRKGRSLSLSTLSVEALLNLLEVSRDEGSLVVRKLKEKHISERKNFRLHLGDWGNLYEEWCEELQTSYLKLLETQYKEQEDTLHTASLKVLEENDISEKELQDSLKLYMLQPEVVQALSDMNEFEPHSMFRLPLSELFQILCFRTERAEDLRRNLVYSNSQTRLLLIKGIVEDETLKRFGYDNLKLRWSIKTASKDLDTVWESRLLQLQERFSDAICS